MPAKRLIRTLSVAALLPLALIAAACGGGTDRDSTAGTEDTATHAGEPTGSTGPRAGEITLAADGFRPGEPIPLTFRLERPATTGAWVGLIPAAVTSTAETDNDAADVTYESVPEGSTSGSLKIAGQGAPGRYRLRLFAADDEAAAMLAESPVFEIRPWSWPEGEGPSLTLSATELSVDDELSVELVLPEPLAEQAWVGIVPTEVTTADQADNDAADVAYEYLGEGSRVLRFGDLPPGEYFVRLFPCSEAACAAVAQAGPVTVR